MSETSSTYIAPDHHPRPEKAMSTLNLIENISAAHNLPFPLVFAIVQVESGGNPHAIRYEPAFFSRYVAGKGHTVYSPCSRATEEQLRAFSFGLMQIMGQSARELGFTGVFLTELLDPATGLDWGCRKLAQQVTRYKGDVESAVAAYNAGSARRDVNGLWVNQGYVEKVRKARGLA